MSYPILGSPEELAAFSQLHEQLGPLYRRISRDDRCRHTVVVIPSLSMDAQELEKITGVHHYEERLLFMLMLLRHPRTRMVYVTSQPVNPDIVDYYLHLLSGVPSGHARRRLHLLSCYDASPRPLTQKILERPRLMQQLREVSSRDQSAHVVCFNSSPLERSLSVRLGLPLYANDPSLAHLGTKSGCRKIFKEADIDLPYGHEDLHSVEEIIDALVDIKRYNPALRKGVVKLNDGFSGEGNALFRFEGCPGPEALRDWVKRELPQRLQCEAKQENWESFTGKYAAMGGIVESFVDGEQKCSPSSQNRVNALGEAIAISTHDQVLGGPSGQVFEGCTFPARPDYRLEVQEAGLRVAKVLARKGVIGRFATDFISTLDPDGRWQHKAIEVNLRKGGTTHPFMTLKFLTDGYYQTSTGLFLTPMGHAKYYYASDTLQSDAYQGMTPSDLIDIAVYHGLHFHGASQRGVVFHLLGALSEFGKLGLVCIGDNPQQARFLYRKTMQVLDAETGG